MWNVKSVLFFVASLVAVVFISMSMANADEKKTYTPQETIQAFASVPGNVVNWFSGEVEKTKDYQAKSWADMKSKWPFTMFKGNQ